MVSFDITDGYYTLGIREKDKDFFTLSYRDTLYRLARLPMGWKCNNYYFCRLTEVFIRQLREQAAQPQKQWYQLQSKPSDEQIM
jgi:hypothetical protein